MPRFDDASVRAYLADRGHELSTREMQMVTLHWTQGLPIKTAAARLGVSDHRARQLIAAVRCKARTSGHAPTTCYACGGQIPPRVA